MFATSVPVCNEICLPTMRAVSMFSMSQERSEPEVQGHPEESLTPPVEKRLPGSVLVVDWLTQRRRRLTDLYAMFANLLGILVVLLLSVYAQSTTQGLTEDVQLAFQNVIRQLLLLPLSTIEVLFVLVAPAVVIIALTRRREYASIVSALATGTIAGIVGWLLTQGIPSLPSTLTDSLTVNSGGSLRSLDVVILVLVAAITSAGDSSQMKSLRYTWYGIWIVLLIGVIRGTLTVPGMLVTVLLGRVFGMLGRWVLGFSDRRATPTDLVEAILATGLVPAQVIRATSTPESSQPHAWLITESDSQPDFAAGLVHPELLVSAVEEPVLPEGLMPQSRRQVFADRQYQVLTATGLECDLHVLDPSSAVVGTLGEVWNNLRLRGLSRWISPTQKANAERAVLTADVAKNAGVQTPGPLGIAEAGASIAVLWEKLPQTTSLIELHQNEEEISDEILLQAWQHLAEAHSRGAAHRNLDLDTLVVGEQGDLWILNWDQGEVATGELNRHIDRAQMLAHLALVAGPQRALAAAQQYFSLHELLALSVVLQPAILPPALRDQLRKTDYLGELRTRLAEMSEQTGKTTPPAPIRLQRFSMRTMLMVVLLGAIIIGVIGSLNFEQIVSAVQGASIWWAIAAFLIGSTTWAAAAMPLVAFAPKKIGLPLATVAQMGGSLANVVAPAGVGPAAFNLRFLTKQGITMPLAVATVTLVQISQFLTSVVLLVVIVVITGTSLDVPLPAMTIVWVAATVLALAASVLAIPKVRNWAWAKAKPTWEQIYPQLVWILGHPKELSFAMAGNLLGNLGYIGAFAASLAAFGYTLSPMTVTLTFLVSTTLGSVVPSPGGIGTVEAALTGGLQVAGVPPGIAVSAAVLYRLVTFYGRIPFGWVAMQYLGKKNYI